MLDAMKNEQMKKEATVRVSKDKMASLADANDQDLWAWVASDVCSARPTGSAVVHCAHRVVGEDTLRLVRCLLERAHASHGPSPSPSASAVSSPNAAPSSLGAARADGPI